MGLKIGVPRAFLDHMESGDIVKEMGWEKGQEIRLEKEKMTRPRHDRGTLSV